MKIRILSSLGIKLDGLQDQIKDAEQGLRALIADSSALQTATMNMLKELGEKVYRRLSDVWRAQQYSAMVMTRLYDEIQWMQDDRRRERDMHERDREQIARERYRLHRLLEQSQRRGDELERGK